MYRIKQKRKKLEMNILKKLSLILYFYYIIKVSVFLLPLLGFRLVLITPKISKLKIKCRGVNCNHHLLTSIFYISFKMYIKIPIQLYSCRIYNIYIHTLQVQHNMCIYSIHQNTPCFYLVYCQKNISLLINFRCYLYMFKFSDVLVYLCLASILTI